MRHNRLGSGIFCFHVVAAVCLWTRAESGTTITFKVVDEAGKPVAGAQIAPRDGQAADAAPLLTDNHGVAVYQRTNWLNQMPRGLLWQVHHTNYASAITNWYSRGEGSLPPTEITVALEKGRTIGGTVTDHTGRPLAGVRVYNDQTLGWERQISSTWSSLDDVQPPVAVTDANGKWQTTHLASTIVNLKLTFVRPNGGMATFRSDAKPAPPNRPSPYFFDDQPKVAWDALEKQEAKFALPENLTIAGVVVDESEKPIPNAAIREGFGSRTKLATETNADAQGRFTLANRPARYWVYTVNAPGHALASTVVQVTNNLDGLKLVAPRAQPLRITVLDAEKKPLQNATVFLVGRKIEAQVIDWEARTDSAGVAVWTNAPLQEIKLAAAHGEYFKELSPTAGQRDYTIVLDRRATDKTTLTLHGTNAKTGAPVKIETVSMHYQEPQLQNLANPNAAEATVEIPGDLRRLRFEAAGYKPITLENVSAAEGNRVIDLKFTSGSAKKRILLPTGEPAAGARVWAQGMNQHDTLFMNGQARDQNRYYGDRLAHADADENGFVEVPPVESNRLVYVTHKEGSVTINFDELDASNEIRLLAWGKLEGHVFTAGEPTEGADVLLGNNQLGQKAPHVLVSARSKNDGSFAFAMLPPGLYQINRNYNPKRVGMHWPGQYAYVEVKPGETTRFEYNPKGRQITGLAIPSLAGADIDWRNEGHFLVSKPPEKFAEPRINTEDFVRVEDFQAANDARFNGGGAARERFMAKRQYVLVFEPSGSFRIDDVPPGAYELNIRVTRPPEPGTRRPAVNPFNAETIAELRRDVVVPNGAGVFDLGRLQVAVTGAAKTKAADTFGFIAKTADGRPVSLNDMRGTNLIVTIWAAWSDRSREHLEQIEKLRDEFKNDPTLAFLNVRADTGGAAEPLDNKSVSVSGADVVKLATALNISALPTSFLIDREGRILARDLDRSNLRRAIERALTSK